MSHVFLRCTFGILLLFLALEPKATATCNEEKIKDIFRNIIMTHITHLEKDIQQYAPSCNQSNVTVSCSRNEAIEAIYNMSRQLERISKICNVTENIKENLNGTVHLIFEMLERHCTVDQRPVHGIGGKKRLCPKCRIKEAISRFMDCWFQFVRRRPP